MSVRIRLRRIGKCPKKRPYFRVTVFNEHRGRDSYFIEEIGFYNPVKGQMKMNKERFDFWIKKGAQPTEAVKNLIKKIEKETKNAANTSG